MLLRPVGATPGSPPVAVWRKGRPPSTACAAKCVRRWAWTRRNPCSRAFSSRPFPTARACGTATSPSSLLARRPPSRVRVPTCGRRGGLRRCPQTSRSGRTTSRISSVSSRPQPFSESPEWRGREPMGPKPAPIVVDIQNDFCPGGALGVPDGDAIIPRVNRTIALFERRHLPVLFTRDWHPRETKHFKEFGGAWPAHCIQGTKGARFHPDLQMPKGAVILSKGMDPEQDSYSAFQAFTDRGRDLESTLHELDVDELFICGLATDYCVRATSLDGLRRGLTIRVIRDAIRGVDLKPGDSEMAIKEMRVHGAQFSDTRGLGRLLPKE